MCSIIASFILHILELLEPILSSLSRLAISISTCFPWLSLPKIALLILHILDLLEPILYFLSRLAISTNTHFPWLSLPKIFRLIHPTFKLFQNTYQKLATQTSVTLIPSCLIIKRATLMIT